MELKTWIFKVDNSEYNHLLTLAKAYPTHQKIAISHDFKITIISQTQVNSLARQIFATLWLGTDKRILFSSQKTSKISAYINVKRS